MMREFVKPRFDSLNLPLSISKKHLNNTRKREENMYHAAPAAVFRIFAA